MHTLLAHELQAHFLSGKLSAEEIASHFLSRIALHDPKLHAFLSVFPERALAHAKRLDQKRRQKEPLGKLAALPIAIKDNIHLKGEITSCASKFLANYKAPFSATAVHLLEEEDALILGKTNMDEFAMGGSGTHSAFHSTKNPWNLSCIPGGSSSGSSACVSAALTPLALGSDTGGSIRQPAAFTGICGFKPSYGRVSRYGLVAFGSSLDQIGPMARCVKDAALVFEVIGAPCKRDSTCLQIPPTSCISGFSSFSLKGKKIGVPWDFLEKLGGEARSNFESSIAKLRDLGAEILDIDLAILKYSIAVYYILSTAEASTNLARFDGIRYGVRSSRAKTLEEIYEYSRKDEFGSEVKTRIMLGSFVLSGSTETNQYTKAQKVRTLIIQKMREAFAKCSVIALPAAPSTAFEFSDHSDPLVEYLQDLYTIAANMGGLPAISVPSGWSQDGKPFGLQLMGPQLHDAEVLCFAHAFESASGFGFPLPSAFQGGSST